MRVAAEFDWERKIDAILEVYARAAQAPLQASLSKGPRSAHRVFDPSMKLDSAEPR
jgi:hypothetical protein